MLTSLFKYDFSPRSPAILKFLLSRLFFQGNRGLSEVASEDYSLNEKSVFAQRRAHGLQKFRNQAARDSFLAKNYGLKLLFILPKDQFCSMLVCIMS